jgi:hypothetical protein
MEEWRDIPGYEDYQVSSLGRVKSLKYGKEHILKSIIVRSGYLSVNLYANGKARLTSIHRIVAKVFIPNPKRKPEVNHKDGNKKNNILGNLEWVTKSENQKHAYEKLHRKNSHWAGYVNIYSKDEVLITQVENTKFAAEWIMDNRKYRTQYRQL